MKQAQHRVGLVLFDGFEVLDVFGPVELFSRLSAEYPISYVASHEGPVRSSQGVEVIATDSFATSPAPDIVMVPGGMGTRELAGNTTFLRELADWAKSAALITSVYRVGPTRSRRPAGRIPRHLQQDGLRLGFRSRHRCHLDSERTVGPRQRSMDFGRRRRRHGHDRRVDRTSVGCRRGSHSRSGNRAGSPHRRRLGSLCRALRTALTGPGNKAGGITPLCRAPSKDSSRRLITASPRDPVSEKASLLMPIETPAHRLQHYRTDAGDSVRRIPPGLPRA